MREAYVTLSGQYLKCVETGKGGKCRQYALLPQKPGAECLVKSPPHPKKASAKKGKKAPKRGTPSRSISGLSGKYLTCAEWTIHKGKDGEYIRCKRMLPTCEEPTAKKDEGERIPWTIENYKTALLSAANKKAGTSERIGNRLFLAKEFASQTFFDMERNGLVTIQRGIIRVTDKGKKALIAFNLGSAKYQKTHKIIHVHKGNKKAEPAPGKPDPWMADEPFTENETSAYNRYSHFERDINADFNYWLADYASAVQQKMKREKVDRAPAGVVTASEQYREAVYNKIKTEIKARNYAPPADVVGPANYKNQEAKRAKADKWREAATLKINKAQRKLETETRKIGTPESKAGILEKLAPDVKWKAWEKRTPPQITNIDTDLLNTDQKMATAYLVMDRSKRKSKDPGFDYKVVKATPIRFPGMEMTELILHESTKTPETWDISWEADGAPVTVQSNPLNPKDIAIKNMQDWIKENGADFVKKAITKRTGGHRYILEYPHMERIAFNLENAKYQKTHKIIHVHKGNKKAEIKEIMYGESTPKLDGAPVAEILWGITRGAATAIALPFILREKR